MRWDVDRIREQLRRWQERLLDLTRANPLLGINRSRVSRLRVVEPALHALFRDLVVEERQLRMPRVVKAAVLPAAGGNGEETETEPQYRIEPGDVTFEATPAELHRKLRRIADNARTSLEERGVTTLHVSFGVLRWEDPILGESISPLWLVPCELESFGPSAPLGLSAADEEALENVQGDERDTIIISVGYGKTASGALSYNFGPLNQEGGWRRLNVLVTRARWQTILVTSMRADELAGINPSNRGAVALRDFLEYAERGCVLAPTPPVMAARETNDFEDAVAERLRERGLHIDQQVGAGEYRIDLAIRDPRDSRRYLLGVECDGATYHSAKTARDRDLLREQVLRDLGWRLHRIWSTDWFRDPNRAIEAVLRSVERAQREPVERSVIAPPIAGASADEGRGVPEPAVREAEARGSGRALPATRRYRGGVPYRKYRGTGRRELLLESECRRALAAQILDIVKTEGPIHEELLLERLKEVNNVARAGANVQTNVNRARALLRREGRVEEASIGFLRIPGGELEVFRIPGDGVQRPLAWIPSEEIELAVLHVVEDQFGCQRSALPKAIAELFGFERAPVGLTEAVETAVDRLIDANRLFLSGPNVCVA